MKVLKNGGIAKFYCPGCKAYHTFQASSKFNGDLNNPTLSCQLVYANAGTVVCVSNISAGKITFAMNSRHPMAGQTVDLPDISGAIPK